ncbi:hypothetical protein HMI54_003802 [Coelomomyces lativittatus]|nr:hypothetical protein HMI55_001322 [Coelomomyces lativittatus]KAJ1507827.1 hypothetical protein HMI54_003802 [Coelomomyces lativittatus]KAJ1512779.1 hypothetical protein HMI56_003547 [Coelomomyces lativittatus]
MKPVDSAKHLLRQAKQQRKWSSLSQKNSLTSSLPSTNTPGALLSTSKKIIQTPTSNSHLPHSNSQVPPPPSSSSSLPSLSTSNLPPLPSTIHSTPPFTSTSSSSSNLPLKRSTSPSSTSTAVETKRHKPTLQPIATPDLPSDFFDPLPPSAPTVPASSSSSSSSSLEPFHDNTLDTSLVSSTSSKDILTNHPSILVNPSQTETEDVDVFDAIQKEYEEEEQEKQLEFQHRLNQFKSKVSSHRQTWQLGSDPVTSRVKLSEMVDEDMDSETEDEDTKFNNEWVWRARKL